MPSVLSARCQVSGSGRTGEEMDSVRAYDVSEIRLQFPLFPHPPIRRTTCGNASCQLHKEQIILIARFVYRQRIRQIRSPFTSTNATIPTIVCLSRSLVFAYRPLATVTVGSIITLTALYRFIFHPTNNQNKCIDRGVRELLPKQVLTMCTLKKMFGILRPIYFRGYLLMFSCTFVAIILKTYHLFRQCFQAPLYIHLFSIILD